MIKNKKNVTRKGKNKNINQLKSIKTKNNLNFEKSTIIPNNPETLKTTKTFFETKKKMNRKIAIYNSISSGQQIKLKNSPVMMRKNRNKQNLKENKTICNKIITSNNIFCTRESDSLSKEKEKEKKFKKYNSNFNKRNISKIKNMFKKIS
jgi:hypothetical protein